MKRIYGFQGEYRWLSNFWPAPIMYMGLVAKEQQVYPTAEHLYQALKTIDPREREAIRTAATPGAAKRLGKTVTMRPSWDRKKDGFMDKVTSLKYGQNPALAQLLIDTGDAELIEANTWHDTYWGVCTCPKHNGAGENMLGKILMDERFLLQDGDE